MNSLARVLATWFGCGVLALGARHRRIGGRLYPMAVSGLAGVAGMVFPGSGGSPHTRREFGLRRERRICRQEKILD